MGIKRWRRKPLPATSPARPGVKRKKKRGPPKKSCDPLTQTAPRTPIPITQPPHWRGHQPGRPKPMPAQTPGRRPRRTVNGQNKTNHFRPAPACSQCLGLVDKTGQPSLRRPFPASVQIHSAISGSLTEQGGPLPARMPSGTSQRQSTAGGPGLGPRLLRSLSSWIPPGA